MQSPWREPWSGGAWARHSSWYAPRVTPPATRRTRNGTDCVASAPAIWPGPPSALRTGASIRGRCRATPLGPEADRGSTTVDERSQVWHDLFDGDVLLLTATPVPELDHTVGEAASDDHDGGHTDQLGVGELHPRGDPGAIVVDDLDADAIQLGGDALGLGVDLVVLAGGDDVHVGGRHVTWPHQAPLVAVGLGQRSDGARDTDAVGTHGDGDLLTVLVENGQAQCVGEPAPEREDVPDLDAACRLEWSRAVGRGVAGPHVGGLNRSVAG